VKRKKKPHLGRGKANIVTDPLFPLIVVTELGPKPASRNDKKMTKREVGNLQGIVALTHKGKTASLC